MHLTYHEPDRCASEASPAKADEAGAPEIKITDEMIAAGVKACEHWELADAPEWKAVDIYREMERARRATASPPPEPAADLAAETA
jgi:hypothetical protein